MEIILGKTAGFCYGVKRAVDGAKEELRKNKEQVFCLGEIVHNKQVVEALEKEGLIFIEDINQAKGKTMVRAHGIPKETYAIAKKSNIELVDYTCPKVLKIHEIVEEYAKNGYYIFLCGNAKHPENIGTISFANKNITVIEKEEEVVRAIEKLQGTSFEKVLLISQTTFSLEKFYIIEEMIKNELPGSIELVVKNTICKATELRQKETEEISKKVDCMIIIGGKNSSNTKKLYEIGKKHVKECICIETADELRNIEIKKHCKIGVMAGASTPQESIQKVLEKLEEK